MGGSGKPGHYAKMMVERKMVYVHRFAYSLWIGPIPDGMTVDHICGMKRCVRPDHLQLLSAEDNVRRYWSEQRTLCRNGLHPVGQSIRVSPWKSGPRKDQTILRCVPCFEEKQRARTATP